MKIKQLAILLLIVPLFNSCSMINQLASLRNCEYKYKSVTDVRVAGIDVQNKKTLKDFTVLDAASLLAAVNRNEFLLNATVNIEITNPNAGTASLDGGEWIFFIDGKEMIRGNVSKKVQVNPSGGVAIMPMAMIVDLKKILGKENRETIAGFGLGLAAGEGQATRVSLWIKPIMNVGGFPLSYPNYIKLGKAF